MSQESPETWPLRPSHSAYVLHGLCMALSDLIQEEGGGQTSRRALIKAAGLAAAAELFAGEVAHFFGSRPPDDHDHLELIQDHYEAEVAASDKTDRD